MDLTFEKWEDGRWFVVLPDYDGDQEDLAGSWEGHGDRYEVNPQSWTQHLLFICEEEH